MTDNLAPALLLHDAGFSIIPLKPRTKRPALNWSPFARRRPTHEQVRDWFSMSDFNVGVVCGEVSGGLLIRDFDVDQAYETWARSHPALASELPTVKTARGFHVYARAEGAIRTRNLHDGEIRGAGAYCVAPASIHESGAVYAWRSSPRLPPPVIDPVVFEVATHNPTDGRTENPWLSFHGPVDQAIQGHLPTRVGEREKRLWNLARDLRAVAPDADAATRRAWVAEWWQRGAASVVGTKVFAESVAAFERSWQRVAFPTGATWASIVQRAVHSDPIQLPPEVASIARLTRFAKLITALNEAHQGGAFPLPLRKIVEFLGCSQATASRDLDQFVALGILECTSPRYIPGKLARSFRVKPLSHGEQS